MKTIEDILLLLILMDIVIKVKTIVDDISEKMPDQFNMHDIMAKCEERTPYIIVCFQVKHSPHCTNTAKIGIGPLIFNFIMKSQPHSHLEMLEH